MPPCLPVAFLGPHQPNEDIVAAFPKIAEQAWTQRQGDVETTTQKINSRLDHQKQLKSELLRAKLRGEVNQADYAQANAEFDTEIAALHEQLEITRSSRLNLEAFLRFTKVALLDVAGAWQWADAEQKVRVQNLLFGDGLRYSQESANFEHPNTCLFRTMEEMSSVNGWLASPTGFEPVLPP